MDSLKYITVRGSLLIEILKAMIFYISVSVLSCKSSMKTHGISKYCILNLTKFFKYSIYQYSAQKVDIANQ